MANHIESVPCSVQTIDSLFTSISITTAISKAITRSFGQSHLTHLEAESSISKTVIKLDDSIHPEVVTDHQLNPKCMTKLDWVDTQSKDKTIGGIIQLFKAKELKSRKGNNTDNKEMRQFIRQQNRLFMRDGIIYCKNKIQDVNHPDRNIIQLVLPKAFRKQALQGCHDDLSHLRIEWTINLLGDCFYWP